MRAASLMSLAAATVFLLGVVGPAVAQTPSTPTPAKGGDTQMDKTEKTEKKTEKKKDAKPANKRVAKKKHPVKKEGAPETKAPEEPKK